MLPLIDNAEVSIRVENLSKEYTIYKRPEDRLKQMVIPRLQGLFGFQRSRYFQPFSALRDVSFAVNRGQTVGIVGRNGSGKSTLLQIICGILQPSSGHVAVTGRIAALLELGAGFNPEFSGRENVILTATLLGLTRSEIDERFESIAAFAEIGEFIDRPVKTYSSGMYMRLAFAVAINADPEILIVDEALAVGDEAFRRKCYSRIEEIQSKGATVLFVSHGAQTIVQLCSSAILLDGGELIMQGEPKAVTAQYQRLINAPSGEAWALRGEIKQIETSPRAADLSPRAQTTAQREKTKAPTQVRSERFDALLVSKSRVEYEPQGAKIADVRLLNDRNDVVNVIELGRTYVLTFEVVMQADARNVGIGTLVKSFTGIELGGTSSHRGSDQRIDRVAAGARIRARLEFLCRLRPGVYFLNAGIVGTLEGEQKFLHRIVDALAIRVESSAELNSTGFVDFDFRHSLAIIPGSASHLTESLTQVARSEGDPVTQGEAC
jgi:lipopolysaccharide transport system ATP-binding protein